MIPQQVNFYQPRFQPQRNPFAIRNILASGFFLLALALTSHLAMKMHLSGIKQEAGVTGSHGSLLVATKNPLVGERICKRMMVRLLPRAEAEKQVPFSPILQGFSQAATPGAWLTAMGIFDNGKTLAIEGQTRNTQPGAVTQLIARLTSQPRFAHHRFRIFHLKKPDKTSGNLLFQLKTGDHPLPRCGDGSEEMAMACAKTRAPTTKK